MIFLLDHLQRPRNIEFQTFFSVLLIPEESIRRQETLVMTLANESLLIALLSRSEGARSRQEDKRERERERERSFGAGEGCL